MSDIFVRVPFYFGPLDKCDLGVHPEAIQAGFIEFGPHSLGLESIREGVSLTWIHRYTYIKNRFIHTAIISPPKKDPKKKK